MKNFLLLKSGMESLMRFLENASLKIVSILPCGK